MYWFAWNISKLELSIIKKNFRNYYGYRNFFTVVSLSINKKKDNAFFIETMFIRGLVTDIKTPESNIRARIIPVTFSQNQKLNILYQNYLNRKYLDITLFYRRFLVLLEILMLMKMLMLMLMLIMIKII